MLRLFAGRENIDKERFIYDSIKEHGGEAFVLVPNQYTLVAEEQALKYLETDCLFDVEILSMNRLGLRILQEQGTESVDMLDKYGRFMLLSMIIREHADELELFSRSAGKISFTSMLNDFISEFKQQDCTLDEIDEMLGERGEDPVLGAKLRELKGIIKAYEEAVEGRFTDSEDYIAMYVDAIKSSRLVRGKSVWIYGYDNITPKFAGAMMELAKVAGSVNFIVNRSDFGLDRKLIAGLERLAAENGIEISCEEITDIAGSKAGGRYVLGRSETIDRIDRYMWKAVLSEEDKAANRDFVPDDLTIVSAANPYYEAESAAAYVWHLIRDEGYMMRDIQVIANDEGVMQPIIRRIFAEYGLPVFADSSRDITDSAAVGFIVNLLGFIVNRRSTPYLFAMLKTGLGSIEDKDIEELENYARAYHIKGSMWDKAFRYGADDLGEENLARLDGIRSILSEKTSKLAGLTKDACDVSSFARGFAEYLESEWALGSQVEEAAKKQEEAGLIDEAQRMIQSYDKAMEILGQIDEIMGERPLDLAEFTEIYISGLSDAEVGVIPPSLDGLSMGTMIRTRPRRIKAAVILGANEGVMPLDPKTEGLFSLDEKEYFKSKGFALGRLDDLKMEEENAAMQRMLARPSEKLYISWSMTDAGGNDASPSPVIESLLELFPRIKHDGLLKSDIISSGSFEAINTADDGMRHLINRVKSLGPGEAPDGLTAAMLKWYSVNRKDELDVMLDAAAYDNSPAPLRPSAAKALFGRENGGLVMSASSIGSYIDCPFKYYVERGLRPKEERSFESDPRTVGDVYHECLMKVARQLMGDTDVLARLRDGDTEELERIVSAALDEIAGSYRGGLFLSTGNEEYRMSRIREICAAAAKAMATQLASDTVKGALFEERFGRHGRFGPIRLEAAGEEVLVEGTIDRADLIDADGEDRVRIIDYKTGSDSLDLWKMRHGIKMQLMIYMISASTENVQPAGMFYFNIKDPMMSVNDKSEKSANSIINREAEDEFKLKGLFLSEEGVLEAMPPEVLSSSKNAVSREAFEEARTDVIARIEETAEGILGGKIDVRPLSNDKKLVCNYCSLKSVCRRDRGYVRNSARKIPDKPKD